MATVKSDIEIARAAKMKPIIEIGEKLGLPPDSLVPYGHTKAKVSLAYIDGTQLDFVREGLNEGFKFNNPNSSIGFSGVARITSAGSPTVYQRTSRQVQLALKVYF